MDSIRNIFEKGYKRLFESTGAHLTRYREAIEPITGPLEESAITVKNATLVISIPSNDAAGLFLKKEKIKKAAQEAVPQITIKDVRFTTR